MFRQIGVIAFLSAIMSAAGGWGARAGPPPIEAYGQLPGIAELAMSPSGARYAFVARVADGRRLIVMSADGKVLVNAEVGATKVRSLQWAGEDHLLIHYSGTTEFGESFISSRVELGEVVAYDLANHKTVTIFSGQSRIVHMVAGVFGHAAGEGHWYGYFGGVTSQDATPGEARLHSGSNYPDLYRVDLDTGEARKAASGGETVDGWLVGPDGAVIAHASYDGRDGAWTVSPGGFGGKPIANGTSRFRGPALARGRSPDTLLIWQPEANNDHGAYEEVSLSTGQTIPLPDRASTAEPLADRQTGLWIGVVNEGDKPDARLFDPLSDARLRAALKPFADRWTQLVAHNTDFTRVILFTSGGGDSGTYWLVDVAKGQASPIGYPYPAIAADDVGPVRMVDWKASDGLALRGVLSLPPGRPAKSLPLVVMPHGGPEARDYPNFDWWAQAFAARGYAVFQPNFRGSSGYGAAFRDAGFGEWGRKMQTDVSDGVAELARQGVVDPQRACIVGASYGGYAALAGVTLQHGIYRCAVADAGVSDLPDMINYAEERQGGDTGPATRYWRTFMGPKPEEVSPIRFAARADAPVLLIHGKDDSVVPYEQSQRMLAALKAAGKTAELVTMPGEDHWLSRGETRLLMLQSAVAFVEKYNPPDPAPVVSPAPSPGP